MQGAQGESREEHGGGALRGGVLQGGEGLESCNSEGHI